MRIPVGATVMTACGVAILAGLGTWQIQRLHWKEDVIARLNAGYDSAAKAEETSEEQLTQWAAEEQPIGYARANGHLMREEAVLLGPRTNDGRVGYHLLVPMETHGHILIVNTGWVDGLWKDDTESRLAGLPMDNVTVRGAIHKPDWSSFASKNSPENNMWFRADIAEIAQAKELKDPYPFILYADRIEPALHEVTSHEERWLPRNKHMQYALFWYAMGAALLGVYGFYVAGLNKKKAP